MSEALVRSIRSHFRGTTLHECDDCGLHFAVEEDLNHHRRHGCEEQ